MATTLKPVDAVVVGFGWTGAILAKELTEAGLNVVALERGENRDTYPDGAYPNTLDELTYNTRGKLFQNLSKSTVSIRHGINDTALPYRQLSAFLPGDGVGGAGLHWSGVHFRIMPEELRLRSHYEERYGKKFIPEGMTIQDYGVSYEELEPHFDFAEKVFGTSGTAHTVKGQVVGKGNPFAADRSDDFPLPALRQVYSAQLFRKAAEELGLHPYDLPAANASGPWTNPYGVQMGPCNFCGFCSGYACYMYSKASPNLNILPALRQTPLFELRANCNVLKVNLDSDGRQATGVTYVDAQGREIVQPAKLVIISAFQFHNVRLLLLSGIGKPYDPRTGEGVVGKNFAYQNMATIKAFFDKDVHTNPFVGTGGGGVAVDDFNADNFDHGPLGFVGGSPMWVNQAGSKPIGGLAVPPGTPSWGQRLETGGQGRLHAHRVDGRPRQQHDLPRQLPRPRPDLQGRLRPATAAHDLRLEGQRDPHEPLRHRAHAQDRRGDEPEGHLGERQELRRPLQYTGLPDHPPARRGDHGQRSEDQRAQPLPAELGRAQCLRHGRLGLPPRAPATTPLGWWRRWPTGRPRRSASNT
ncbi:gluconate dehydrogenase [Pseudomonas aeruginosa]|nr:gluconate dehydrogenase [Pseudomonas aeruginosa]